MISICFTEILIHCVQVTGASVQVASEMLPNSTERAVTISGNSEAVIQCIYHICVIMSEVPIIPSTLDNNWLFKKVYKYQLQKQTLIVVVGSCLRLGCGSGI